jgi:hypothetical protein
MAISENSSVEYSQRGHQEDTVVAPLLGFFEVLVPDARGAYAATSSKLDA